MCGLLQQFVPFLAHLAHFAHHNAICHCLLLDECAPSTPLGIYQELWMSHLLVSFVSCSFMHLHATTWAQ